MESDWVFGQEPTGLRVEISRPVKVESGFAVELAPRVLERIRQRAGGRGLFPERIDRVSLSQCSGSVAQRSDRAERICVVVACRTAAEHRKGFVDVETLGVPSDNCAGGVCLFDKIAVIIVGVDGSAGT